MAYKRISPQPVIEGGTGAVTLTNHGALIGAGTGAVTAAAPGSVAGKPLISQGSSADPVFGIAEVVGGGTGGTTWTAYSLIAAGTTSTGSFQNISGVGSSGQILTSNGAGMLPTWQAASASGIVTIDGDTGSATGATVTFNGNTFSGSSVNFVASGATVDFEVTDGNDNTLMGDGAGNGALSGTSNTGFGPGVLNHLTIGSDNTAFGINALTLITSGSFNTALGFDAGSAYASSESSNISIGYGTTGTVSESNVLRIGNGTGTGNGNVNKAFISGINGITVASGDQVLLVNSSNQVSAIANGTNGQVLTSAGAGANPTWQTLGGASISITGDSGGALTSGSFTFTGGTTGLTFAGASTTETLTGTLVVSNGGTGRATLTNHGVLVGAGTTAITQLAVGTTGQVLTGVTGADPVWAAPAASSISITGNSGGALTGNAFTFTGGTTGLTFSGAGSTETLGGDLVVANGGTGNTTFTAYSVICAGTTATGAFQNVSGLGSSGNVLTSNGAGALPTWQAAGGGGINRIDGDVDYVTGSTVTISTDQAGSVYSGKSVQFKANSAGGTFLYLFVSDAFDNTFVGSSAGVDASVFVSGGQNTSLGGSTLASISSNSTANNTAIGFQALSQFTGGNNNTAIGNISANSLLTGSSNTLVGSSTGGNYTSSESSNILIGFNTTGTTAESNVLRIGNATGSSAGNLNKAFICGIDGVNVGSVAKVLTMASDQLGTATITAGTGITVTPGANTITIAASAAGFTWSVITANQTAAVNNGYICNKAGTLALALPASAAVGSIIEVTGINTATGWQITQASGQQIFFGASSTTSGATGTLTSSAIRDAIRIVCITANTTWQVLSSVGNITVV